MATENDPPDIIAITEVKPKNSRFLCTPEEFGIQSFQTFHCNLDSQSGRGVIVYVSKDLESQDVSCNNSFEEFIMLGVKLRNNDMLTLICSYRSPNSTPENNTNLLSLLDSVDNDSPTHLLLMGDFNYGAIDWSSGRISGSSNELVHDVECACAGQSSTSHRL